MQRGHAAGSLRHGRRDRFRATVALHHYKTLQARRGRMGELGDDAGDEPDLIDLGFPDPSGWFDTGDDTNGGGGSGGDPGITTGTDTLANDYDYDKTGTTTTTPGDVVVGPVQDDAAPWSTGKMVAVGAAGVATVVLIGGVAWYATKGKRR